MESMAEEFAGKRIIFLFVYVREAHPGERYLSHRCVDDKISNAKDMLAKWNIKRRMLVDDISGVVHRAYGSLPNMTYILGAGGSIIYRASWTDARTIKIALDQIVYERDLRRNHTRVSPFFVEWIPQRGADRLSFIEGLADDAGPRAVKEFIEAVEFTTNETTAKPLWDWWDERQEKPPAADHH